MWIGWLADLLACISRGYSLFTAFMGWERRRKEKEAAQAVADAPVNDKQWSGAAERGDL